MDRSNRILFLDRLILTTKIRIGTISGVVATTGGFAGGKKVTSHASFSYGSDGLVHSLIKDHILCIYFG